MSAPQPRSRLGRPVRRVRRWARHTPNGDIALTLIALGATLVLLAVVVGVFVL